MAISWLSRTASNQMQAAAVQANATGLNTDVSPGSITLAIIQAVTGVALWLQALVVNVIAMTRLATSSGGQVDTFGADFGFARLAASAASGSVTFSRATTTSPATILVGSIVSTGPGGTQFAVGTDTTNSLYSAAANGYVVPAGTASATVPVTCTATGAVGNVAAGTITSFYTPIPYVDTVTNGAPLTNGVNAESDAAAKARFVLFVNSRTAGTMVAVENAIASVQQGLFYNILPNSTAGFVTTPGTFTVIIDDGSGAPPSSLLATVYAAIDAVRPLGTSFSVIAPTVIVPTISFSIQAAPGYSVTALEGPAANAVLAYIETLTIGQALAYSKIAQAVYAAVPGMAEVDALYLNGAAGVNLQPNGASVVRATLANITVS